MGWGLSQPCLTMWSSSILAHSGPHTGGMKRKGKGQERKESRVVSESRDERIGKPFRWNGQEKVWQSPGWGFLFFCCDPRSLLFFFAFLLARLFLFLLQPPPLKTDRLTPMWRAVFSCVTQEHGICSKHRPFVGESLCSEAEERTELQARKRSTSEWLGAVLFFFFPVLIHFRAGRTSALRRRRRELGARKNSTCYVRHAQGALSVLLLCTGRGHV